MKCPKCQSENPEGSAFCGRCGQPLAGDLLCPKCKHVNLADSVFCNKCGQTLGSQRAAQSPVISQPISSSVPMPASSAGGRYLVREFLGEGGKKKVYIARDTVLDFAIRESREMKMQPSLERALRRKEILKA
jgi:hypothetical protein